MDKSRGVIVILEGSEQCGKTTLARKIQDKYKAYYFHGSRPENGNFLEYHWKMFNSALEAARNGHVVVLDRHLVSHQVYGTLFDGGLCYNTHKMHRAMESICELFGVELMFVFCNPARNFDPNMREEMYSDADGKISKAFENAFPSYVKDSKNVIIEYDWQRNPTAQAVLLAIELVRQGEGAFLHSLANEYN